jgi:hypothetical protein
MTVCADRSRPGGGAKFGVFLTQVGWDDATDDSNGAVDRSFSIMIEGYEGA